MDMDMNMKELGASCNFESLALWFAVITKFGIDVLAQSLLISTPVDLC